MIKGKITPEELDDLEDVAALQGIAHVPGDCHIPAMSSRVWPATWAAAEKDRRSRFSSRSQASCLASSSVKVIFTTSAGPILEGDAREFQPGWLPVEAPPTPKGSAAAR